MLFFDLLKFETEKLTGTWLILYDCHDSENIGLTEVVYVLYFVQFDIPMRWIFRIPLIYSDLVGLEDYQTILESLHHHFDIALINLIFEDGDVYHDPVISIHSERIDIL